MRFDLALHVPAVGQLGAKIRTPDHARVAHAEAVEDPALHFAADVEAEAPLQHELQQDEAVPGIGVARARFEVKAQPPVRFQEAEVREARTVREQDARGQLAPALVTGEVAPARIAILDLRLGVSGQGLREIAFDGRIECENTFVHQLHDGIGEHRLRERGAVHDGVALQRIAGRVADTVALHMDGPAVLDHRQRQTLRGGRRHRARDFRIDRGRVRHRRRDAWGSGLSRPSGQRQQAGKDANGVQQFHGPLPGRPEHGDRTAVNLRTECGHRGAARRHICFQSPACSKA